MKKFDTIDDALKDVKKGKPIIVVDDEDRENEGDFIIASDMIDDDKVNFLAKYGRGLICVAMTGERLDELNIQAMVQDNTSHLGTAFTVSVDAREGITTGISAADRARTIKLLTDENTRPVELVKPGHIFPLRAEEGGVLRRAGHTEASVDLARMAGFHPSGVLCEIMDDDGTMARVPKLAEIAEEFDLKMITIEDLIEYRITRETHVTEIASANFPSKFGNFKIHIYKSDIDHHEHLAIVKGDVAGKDDVLVRVHSECLTGDILGSLRCDCGVQLHKALELIEKEGEGVVLYMRQEGRGIGLSNKLKAYHLQDMGLDTVEANTRLGFAEDLRDYGVGAQILMDLGLSTIRILTNNPKKIIGLEGYNLQIKERIPIQAKPNSCNYNYLLTKKEKMGHKLDIEKNSDCGEEPQAEKKEDER
ncbi:MAG: bifunctional 3,4-dihydroxy-2-butanone-4-phosphate synthase/GTP cyclohydrolase II [Candidatus Zixiibacteriota bacterium]